MAADQHGEPPERRWAGDRRAVVLGWLARVLLRSFMVPVLVLLIVLSIVGALTR